MTFRAVEKTTQPELWHDVPECSGRQNETSKVTILVQNLFTEFKHNSESSIIECDRDN